MKRKEANMFNAEDNECPMKNYLYLYRKGFHFNSTKAELAWK